MKTASVNKNEIFGASYRFDPSYHLSEGVEIRRKYTHIPYGLSSVSKVTSRIFYGLRANRIYVTKRDHAIPFLTGASIMQADLNNTKLVSKKYSPAIDEMTIQKGWVMITRSGTVGQTAFSNKLHEGKYGSEDIIRVVPNDSIKPGALYAYLASKYGHCLLTQGSFGAVIQHIEPDFIGNLPIPNFPTIFQQEVDDLIQQSAKLREQAADALEEAHSIIDKEFSIAAKPKENKVAVKNIIKSHTTRLEGSYYTSANRSIYDYVIENYQYKTLKDCSERIFRPGIFKREYLSRGVTFLGGADIMMAIPKSDKKLSYKQVMKMPELQVQKGWILVTCGGTIGNTVYVDNQIAKCVVSQHVMRVVPKEDVLNGYLYAFLSSKIGHELITLFTYGSVIPSVESHHLEKVPIPVLDEEKTKHIDELVQSYVECLELSKLKETLAITMVEEEIEKWQSPTA